MEEQHNKQNQNRLQNQVMEWMPQILLVTFVIIYCSIVLGLYFGALKHKFQTIVICSYITNIHNSFTGMLSLMLVISHIKLVLEYQLFKQNLKEKINFTNLLGMGLNGRYFVATLNYRSIY